ncbi:exonuclease domain-containing protein [Cupriavidus sp. RAF12]|uniref:3'-5' exonuclease n=1 Tax=Cupriavidus sp. RAF12 TaxID=3233050 RepID=UPI003F9299A2
MTLALLFLVQLLIVGAALLPLAIDLPEAQRAWLSALVLQRGALWIALAMLVLLALRFGLKMLFDAYPTPVARLAEDASLLAANPGHRLEARGARGVRVLVDKLNLLAASHQALHDDVQQKIDLANRALVEEKNRLAALMAELALSVLVCNIEGRILLYNDSARRLLETGRSGAPPAGTAAIGLGRSVFGAIERGLILHALEKIQQQLRERGDGAARPVSGFVATLVQGQIVRAHMAPVFDGARALNGFVLTLEDITRHVEADGRRDALLQSLTEDSRVALVNIRAAVEDLQAYPEMSAAKRFPLIGVIDDESQRLLHQIGRAVDQRGTWIDSYQELEEMRGTDLLALLLRRIGSPSLSVVASDTVDATLWLKVDSYALTQALAYLAQRLAAEAGVTELRFGLYRAGGLACLDFTWRGTPLAADTLRVWENTPLPINAAGAALAMSELIARQGGEALWSAGESPGIARYRLMLPVSEPGAALDIPPAQEGRPEFYDFDLFHRPGQSTEVDQCQLSQLNFTVFDTETTGLDPAAGDEIISIGALRIVNGRLLQRESFDQLIQPRGVLSVASIAIHGITEAMLNGQPPIETVLPQFHRFAADTVLVAHNAAFDMKFLQMLEARTGTAFTQPVLDTLLLSQVIHPNQTEHTLEAIAGRLGVAVIGRHTALGDALVTGEVFLKMTPLLAEKGIFTLKEARDAAQQTHFARLRY